MMFNGTGMLYRMNKIREGPGQQVRSTKKKKKRRARGKSDCLDMRK